MAVMMAHYWTVVVARMLLIGRSGATPAAAATATHSTIGVGHFGQAAAIGCARASGRRVALGHQLIVMVVASHTIGGDHSVSVAICVCVGTT